MGVYSDALAPPGFGFWFVVVVGTLLTVGPILWEMIREAISGDHKKDKRGYLAFGLFSALATLVLIHLFGDQRVFSWLYETPDRSSAAGLAGLLVPFGPVFWLLVLVETGVLFFTVRSKSGGWALASVCFTLLAFQFVTGVPVFPTLVHHYVLTGIVFVGYLVAGIAWFLWKWDRLATDHRQRYNAVRSGWLLSKGQTQEKPEYTPQEKLDWETYFRQHSEDEHGLIEFQPRYRDHKSELIGWLMIWPMSMFETLLFDFLADLFNQIYRWFGSVLEAIMLRRWKGTEGHMLTEEERRTLENQSGRPSSRSQREQLTTGAKH